MILIKNDQISKLQKLSHQPVSKKFGYDLGTPIDRYFIENFLKENKDKIQGKVLEIAESTYSLKFGSINVEPKILHVDKNYKADIYCNLETGEGITDNFADCFIMTQTLPFIFNLNEACKNAIRLIKKGGFLLITVPGITQISRYDYERWGQYWSFTEMSLKKLFSQFVPEENITIKSFGNVKVVSMFLYGVPLEKINKEDLEYIDNDYQMVITGVIRK